MQIAIFIALLVIIFLIAPWLISLVLLAVSVYGLIIASAAIIAACIVVTLTFWAILKPSKNQPKAININGERKACKNCFVEIEIYATECAHCGHTQQ